MLASKLRGVLAANRGDETSSLTATFGCYRLKLPDASWVDVLVAEEATDEAEAALAGHDIEGAKHAAVLAESLVRRPFLPGDNGTWAEQKRRELGGIRARALTVLTEACLSSGKAQEAVRWAEQAIDAEPFRESGYRRLMEAHIGAGNRAEALRVYEGCRRLLVEELGAFPSPETETLYRDLLEAPPARRPEAAEPEVAPAKRLSGSRRRRTAAVIGLLLAGGATIAAVAIASRGGSAPPTVVPNSLIRIDPHTLRVTQVVPVDSQPDLVVAAGGFVWVTSHVLRDINSGALRNAGDRTLTRVDPSGKAVVVGGGLAPCGLTADPSGGVWVANCYPAATGSRDNVILVGARTLNFKRTFAVPGGDGFYRGLAFGGGSLWVGNINGGSVANPNSITEIDTQTGTEGTVRPQLPASDLAWANRYGDLWIANFDYGEMTRLHVATGRLDDPIDSRLVNPGFAVVDGDTVWVADWSGPQLARIPAVGAPRARRIVLPTHNRSAGTWDLTAGAKSIWATTPRDGTLWRIDPTSDKVTRIPLPYLPTGLAADANDVWVSVRGR